MKTQNNKFPMDGDLRLHHEPSLLNGFNKKMKTQTKQAHTATLNKPWLAHGFRILDSKGNEVAQTFRTDQTDEFVKAVNCHDELIEALEYVQEKLGNINASATLNNTDKGRLLGSLSEIAQALLKAKGGA